jgi:tetratricopeptide (TPR) repeat protein
MFLRFATILVVCSSIQAQQWKSQDEYDLFQSIVQSIRAGDYNATLAGLEKWKSMVPESEYGGTRLDLYIVTYTQLKRPRAVVDTANEILGKHPDHEIALAAMLDSIYQLGKSPADLAAAEQAARRIIDRADIVYSKENRPPDMTDQAAQQAKTAIQPFAHRTLGWIAVQRGEYEKAVPELIKTLELDPNDIKATLMLGQAYASEKKVELRPLVIFHYARAAQFDGPGGFNESDRNSMLTYAMNQYKNYTRSDRGFDHVLAMSKSAPLPPADFHIDSAAEIAQRELKDQQERDAANPMLALWRNIRTALTKDNGQEYFDSNMKEALLPGGVNGIAKLKGKLVAVHPTGRPKKMELIVAIENPSGDATLQLDQPLPGTMQPGGEIAFEGVAKSFSKDPFTVVFEVERAKVEGWTGKAPPRVARPARK